MKYGSDKYGVALNRDVYAEHFADSVDIKIDYMVHFHDHCVDEDKNPKALAKRLRQYSKRLLQIANFLDKIGRKKNANTKASKVPL